MKFKTFPLLFTLVFGFSNILFAMENINDEGTENSDEPKTMQDIINENKAKHLKKLKKIKKQKKEKKEKFDVPSSESKKEEELKEKNDEFQDIADEFVKETNFEQKKTDKENQEEKIEAQKINEEQNTQNVNQGIFNQQNSGLNNLVPQNNQDNKLNEGQSDNTQGNKDQLSITTTETNKPEDKPVDTNQKNNTTLFSGKNLKKILPLGVAVVIAGLVYKYVKNNKKEEVKLSPNA